MRLIPDSIAGRTIAVLLIGMSLSHILSLAAHQLDVLNQLGVSSERYVAERIVAVKRVITDAPVKERERVAHALSGPSIEVHWSPVSLVRQSSAADARSDALRERLQSLLPDIHDPQIRLSYADEAGDSGTLFSPDHHVLLASLQLEDGSWVNMSLTTFGNRAHDSFDFAVSTTLTAIAIIVLAIVSVRHLTAPLRSLARAAERVGIGRETTPLPETGPKEVRQATRAFNDMQARISKMIADRTQMLAAISHDLRTPITRLRLRTEFVDSEDQRRKMLVDLDEMEGMIGSVLAFLREDSDKEEARVVDLAAILETICDDMADAGHDVQFQGKTHAPMRGKPLALKRAFTNLIDNGCKYGSTVVVSLNDTHSGLRIDIDDNGPGIPDAEKENVFAPFYRLETSRSRMTGGTGLGLTVARSVIDAHGGTIVLANQPHGGLRVTVRLPALEAVGKS